MKKSEVGKLKTIWVITSEYNLYEQQGDYFEGFYFNKPTFEQLEKEYGPKRAKLLLDNSLSNRIGTEGSWYNLEEVEEEI